MAAVLDRPQINLASVKTSITSIVEAQLDKINTMESSREIFLFIRNLFDKHNIDTKKSRDIIQNLATMRNVENARAYIYNFCLKGEGQGTLEIDKKPRYKSKMFKIDEKLKKIVSEDIEKIEVETSSEEITVETNGNAVKVEVEPKTNDCTNCDIPAETTINTDDYEFFSDLNPEIDIDDIDTELEATVNTKSKSIKESKNIDPYNSLLIDAEDIANQLDSNETENDDIYQDLVNRIEEHNFSKNETKKLNKILDDAKTLSAGISNLISYLTKMSNKNKPAIKESATGSASEALWDYVEYADRETLVMLCQGFIKWLSEDDCKEFARIYEIISEEDLIEGAFSGGYAGDSNFSGGTIRGVGASTKPDHKTYLGRLKSKNPELVDITVVKGKDIKPGMITQAGQVKEAEVKKNSRGETKVYIMHTNDYDGFWDVDEDLQVLADPNDKSKPFTGNYNELLKMGLKESKSIKETLSVAEFIDWHETTNYKDNENTFEAVYSILDKYPESEDDVKAQYAAASDEDKEAISRIIDKANETATEEPTVYLARAMHKMYVDGYNYQEIADTLGAPVSLVIKMIGSASYDESLTESTEKQYLAIDTQDKNNKDNNRKYTEKQLIDFAKELIKIEEESSEPDQYKKRPELKDDLASAKKVLKYFMYNVKEVPEDNLNESFDLDDYRNMEHAEYESREDAETVRTYTVYLPTHKGKEQVDIYIMRDFEADIDEDYDEGAWYVDVEILGDNLDERKLKNYIETHYSCNIYATRYSWSDIIYDAEIITEALVEMDQDDINQFLK